jgi:hypothetical protein
VSIDTLSDLDGPPGGGAPPPAAWYRHRGVLLGAVIAVVLVIAVLTDLPTPQSHATNVAAANAFVYEVNQDLRPCDYAVQEAYVFHQEQLDGTLSTENRANLASQLNDDAVACSYVDPSVTDLTSLDSPGTTVAQPLGQMLATATIWVASDAQEAIGTIQSLFTDPTNAKDLATLARETRRLTRDRASARASMASADAMISAQLSEVNLPALTDPTASASGS